MVAAGLAILPFPDASGLRAQVAEASRVAVIDVQRLVFESDTGKEVLDRLKNLQEQAAAESETRQQEINELRDRVEQGRISLSEDQSANLAKELEDKMIALRRFEGDTERSLQKEQQEAFSRIESEMMPIINAVGREQGFTLIFNKFNSGLLFAIDEVDITDQVLERYNSGAQSEDG
jgi:outer membrane protein